MTKLLYLETDALEGEAHVTACEPVPESDLWAVTLDATLFHYQGGGQLSDTGRINDAAVVKVIRTEDGVVHLTTAPLALGAAVMQVDEKVRALHARLHSAGHLLSVACEAMGWRALKGSHQPGQCRVVFCRDAETIEVPVKEVLQAAAQAFIDEALPLVVTDEGGMRHVTWGELPSYGCGGTHVKNTRDVGQLLLDSVKFKKGELKVSYHLAD